MANDPGRPRLRVVATVVTVGWYTERLLPRVVDVALVKHTDGVRARVASGLQGEVLEVGFGSGRNVPHLPREVTRGPPFWTCLWVSDTAQSGKPVPWSCWPWRRAPGRC